MAKSKEMLEVMDTVTSKLFGRKISKCMEAQTCVTCGQSATEFKDALSEKEYKISGMCQKCQDDTFEVAPLCSP